MNFVYLHEHCSLMLSILLLFECIQCGWNYAADIQTHVFQMRAAYTKCVMRFLKKKKIVAILVSAPNQAKMSFKLK